MIEYGRQYTSMTKDFYLAPLKIVSAVDPNKLLGNYKWPIPASCQLTRTTVRRVVRYAVIGNGSIQVGQDVKDSKQWGAEGRDAPQS